MLIHIIALSLASIARAATIVADPLIMETPAANAAAVSSSPKVFAHYMVRPNIEFQRMINLISLILQ
jgi:hypothetical protein